MCNPPGAAFRPSLAAMFALSALTFFSLAPARCVAATTYYISPSGSDANAGTQAAPFKTLQKGVTTASTGDTVTLVAGTYTGPGNVDIDPAGKSVTFSSVSGATTTIIDCGGSDLSNPQIVHRAFYIHTHEANVVINDITIKNGYENNNGGAIAVEDNSTATLAGCVFSDDLASNSYGGCIYNAGTATLMNCTFSNNFVYNGSGGDIYNSGTATLKGCSLNSTVANYAGFPGGAGGGIYNTGSAALTLMGCTVSGKIYSGLYNLGTATLMDCALSHNIAPNGTSGGGIYNGGTVTLTSTTLTSNTASSGGGGIYNLGTTTLTDCTLTNNSAGSGGGILNYNPATLMLTGCTLSGNQCAGSVNDGYGTGGGISNGGPATLINCIFMQNIATGNGGGIDNGGELTSKNCVFLANSTSSGNGAGINNHASGAAALIQFCTFYKNRATAGGKQGGALENDGMATLTDDILWANTASTANEIGTANTGSPVTIATYSDIQDGYNGTGNLHADPLFVNATTPDLHVQSNSPCIGAGFAVTDVTTDLSGSPRSDPPTLGVYEFPRMAAHVHILWTNTNGMASLWSVTPNFAYTQTSFGPYAGWTAKAVSDAPDGSTHILWTNANGTASVWNVVNGRYQSEHDYGPYSGWAATSLSTGGDAASHLLWDNASGTAAAWTLNTGTGTFTQSLFGPYAGWTAQAIASGATVSDLLWTNTDGRASGWQLGSSGSLTTHDFGPFGGWTSVALSVGPDDKTHLLWDNTNGTAALWGVNLSTGIFTDLEYGPYSGWSAKRVATGPDDSSHLLWVNTDGRASLWTVGTSKVSIGPSFGPYAGWTAAAVSAGP